MKKLTNKEIVGICEEMRKKHSSTDWGFRVKQSKNKVKIYWGYLEYAHEDKNSHFLIEEDTDLDLIIIKNEHGEMINLEVEDDSSLEGAIQSAVYYMVSRY